MFKKEEPNVHTIHDRPKDASKSDDNYAGPGHSLGTQSPMEVDGAGGDQSCMAVSGSIAGTQPAEFREQVVSESSASCQPATFPGQGQSLGDGIQSSMEVDGASGGQRCIDWQFYFDTLSPKLSECLDDLTIYLGIPSDKLVSIRKEYTTEHERCFHILWAWYNNKSGGNDTKRLNELHDALADAGRKALAEEDIPIRSMYLFNGDIHDGENKVKEGREPMKVAKQIGDACTRLGRYFKLKEDDISRFVSNNNTDSVKQGKAIIEACLKQQLLRTRQDLCNGLNYVDNTRLIDEMNKFWSG